MVLSTFFRGAALSAGAVLVYCLGAVGFPLQGAAAKSRSEVFVMAVEYRTPTTLDIPLPSGTDNVQVYQVPAGKRLRLQSYLLPMGIPSGGGSSLAPLGLGLLQSEKTAVPMTVPFGTGYDLVRLEPGLVFEPNARIVVRFDSTIQALTGSLFLHGTLEDGA